MSNIFKQEISLFLKACLVFKDAVSFQLGCCSEFCNNGSPIKMHICIHICEKNKVLSVDKVKSMYKKGKVHGEEY